MKRITTCVVAFAWACSPGPPSEADYTARVTAARTAKNAALSSDPTLVPTPRRGSLLPLLYYPVDPSYDVASAIVPSTDAAPRAMVYSDGAVRSVRRVGTLRFRLDGRDLELGAFVEVGASEQSLFIPFGDLTNGSDTYPAGRLLDVERTATGVYDLDFNKAYNPSCYYNPTYSCPLPPSENKLPVAIPAGERARSDQH